MLLFVGDDWAEDHHDVEIQDESRSKTSRDPRRVGIQDESGRRLAKVRLLEGVAGMARLHALVGEHLADLDSGARTD